MERFSILTNITASARKNYGPPSSWPLWSGLAFLSLFVWLSCTPFGGGAVSTSNQSPATATPNLPKQPPYQAGTMPALQFVSELKLAKLLPDDEVETDRLEASGVQIVADNIYVVFDNLPHVARLNRDLSRFRLGRWLYHPDADSALGFEDITYNPHTERFYLLVEAVSIDEEKDDDNDNDDDDDDTFQSRVIESSVDVTTPTIHWLDFEFEHENKGFEGLAYLHRGGADYLLALCEGNKCRGGKKGRKSGGGRVHIFQKMAKTWMPAETLKLPKFLDFEDYAAISIDSQHRVAIISQASSALWIGELSATEWAFVDAGTVYPFPTSADDEPLYCNVEGVSWLSDSQLVVVSDRAKKDQADTCQTKDESIHVFELGRIE
ncbi:hypothetical protein QUF63_09105 [Anaerolineales bacterium HSG25]|nr:hypothetical protein [Anaerolineales bacterium HSG25]